MYDHSFRIPDKDEPNEPPDDYLIQENCDHELHLAGNTIVCKKCGFEPQQEYCPICGSAMLIGKNCPCHYFN